MPSGPAPGATPEEHAEQAAAWREIALWWLGSRLLVVALAVLVTEVGWPRSDWRSGFLLDHGPLALLGAWDGRWYSLVAEHGYVLVPGYQSNAAFFPLLPIALHAGHALGISYAAAGAILSSLAFLTGLIALYELGKRVLPEADARRAAVLAAVFPVGAVFSMAYAEGLAFAAIALAWLAAVRGRFGACALLAACAALARPQGFLVALPIAAVAISGWHRLDGRDRGRAVAATLAAPAALGSAMLYQWAVLGSPLAWSQAERAWGRSFSPAGPLRAVERLVAALPHDAWPARDAVFFILYLALLAVALRAGVPRSWVAFGALLVLLPVASGSFESVARFGLLALPAYWGLAVLARRAWLDRLLRLAFPALLAAGVLSLALHSP